MATPPQPRLRTHRRQPGDHPGQSGYRTAEGLRIRIQIRVKPGAGRLRVGGRYGDDILVVAVTAPPVDGRATEAALKALAKAIGCRPSEVSLLSGATSRTKTVKIPDDAANAIARLLNS